MTVEIEGSRPSFRPVRIVATLSEPVVYAEDGLHIDGPLAWAALQDLDARTRRRIPPASSAWPVDLKMPVARWRISGEGQTEISRRMSSAWRHGAPGSVWGWCGSAGFSADSVRGMAEIRKRPAADEMVRWSGDRSLDLGAGALKAYDLPIPTIFARKIEWWALGESAWIRSALERHVPAIGRKRGLGFGTVASWCVEECADDWSVIRDGRAQRRLPVSAALSIECGSVGVRTIRPPYHHYSRRVSSVEAVGCL